MCFRLLVVENSSVVASNHSSIELHHYTVFTFSLYCLRNAIVMNHLHIKVMVTDFQGVEAEVYIAMPLCLCKQFNLYTRFCRIFA